MSIDIADEIQKEYGPLNFTNASIKFEYNKIEITQKLTLFEKIFFILGIVANLILMAALGFKNWYPGIMLIIILSILFVLNYYRIFDRIVIDFSHKEIRIQNKLSLVNEIKKIIKRKTVYEFYEVATFKTSSFSSISGFNRPPYGLRVGRFLLTEIRTYLVACPFDYSPFEIISSRFERDARRFGELLQYYIVGKPGIIK
jgi:hypothetical protein